MDVKAVTNSKDEYLHSKSGTTNATLEYGGLFSQGNYGIKRNVSSTMSYFSIESLLFLICLAALLLLLPLILPPLPPPPPFMLLMIPIFILLLLMVLAFMPSSNVMWPGDLTNIHICKDHLKRNWQLYIYVFSYSKFSRLIIYNTVLTFPQRAITHSHSCLLLLSSLTSESN